jgi:hypothetical protein
MTKLRWLAPILVLGATVAVAQPTTQSPPRYTVATKPPCADGSPKIIALTNAQATSPCTSASTGTLDVLCQCKDGTYSELGIGDGPTNYAASASPAGPASSVAANSVALSTDTTGNYVSTAATGGGLALVGTEGASLGLLTTCADTQILKWSGAPTSAWACAADGPTNYAASASAGGPASSVAANSVALGTDTTGGYAGSTTEGGAATTATALAADPTDCGAAGTAATGIAASGNLTCGQIAGTGAATVVVAASNSLNPGKADVVCSGTADQGCINSAIALLPAGGGRVLLQEGTYTITAPIVPNDGAWISGSGKGTIITLPGGSAGGFNIISGLGVGHRNNITVSDMTIDANAAPNVLGVYAAAGSGLRVFNSWITNATGSSYGIQAVTYTDVDIAETPASN